MDGSGKGFFGVELGVLGFRVQGAVVLRVFGFRV